MSTRHWWQGWDPGESGACLLLDPNGDAVVLWTWRTRKKDGLTVYQVAILQGDKARDETVETLHDVGVLIRDGTARVTGCQTWGVCSENTFMHNSIRTTLSIARTQGKIIGPSERHAVRREILFVQPDKWRKEHLPHDYKNLVQPVEVPAGKLPKPGHFAKAASLHFIPRRLSPLALWLPRASEILGVRVTKLDHCTDAGGVALYGAKHGET